MNKKVSILSSKWCHVIIILELYFFLIFLKKSYLFCLANSSIDIDMDSFCNSKISSLHISRVKLYFFCKFLKKSSSFFDSGLRL